MYLIVLYSKVEIWFRLISMYARFVILIKF
jgi:hypothetical protein